ncbi:acyl-CoA dehydrogenase family protein [Sphingomonas sp. SRS2]|uniref:acyl-CoA dehydrogenase family protein n=1 Tax=Sphingomonas sp. SRS2 TaxID=133190 RepID=UPI000695F2B6|nr:acyl-CoA dehydrogenase family protein [Sphingomonas sp. SRS2]
MRAEVSDFLDHNLPAWWNLSSNTLTAGKEHYRFCRTFGPALAERGYLTPHWPKAYGGRDAGSWELFALTEILFARGEPRGQQYMGVNWVGPAIMRYGTNAQKDYFLNGIANGLLQFCQGFSEPDAGSDLAALSTRAIRDDDQYVINGQKTWTSYALTADYCFLLVRTDPQSTGRAGLSILLMPMDVAGLSIRPIPNVIGVAGGEHGFCELFFDDVRVPDSSLLGTENDGWKVALDALAFERIGLPRYARGLRLLNALYDNADTVSDDMASTVGQAMAACLAARSLNYRVVDARAKSVPPGPEGNVARLATVWAEQDAADALLDFSPDAFRMDSVADEAVRASLPAGHAAGSIEVNLGLIAHRLLALPKVR